MISDEDFSIKQQDSPRPKQKQTLIDVQVHKGFWSFFKSYENQDSYKSNINSLDAAILMQDKLTPSFKQILQSRESIVEKVMKLNSKLCFNRYFILSDVSGSQIKSVEMLPNHRDHSNKISEYKQQIERLKALKEQCKFEAYDRIRLKLAQDQKLRIQKHSAETADKFEQDNPINKKQ